MDHTNAQFLNTIQDDAVLERTSFRILLLSWYTPDYLQQVTVSQMEEASVKR